MADRDKKNSHCPPSLLPSFLSKVGDVIDDQLDSGEVAGRSKWTEILPSMAAWIGQPLRLRQVV